MARGSKARRAGAKRRPWQMGAQRLHELRGRGDRSSAQISARRGHGRGDRRRELEERATGRWSRETNAQGRSTVPWEMTGRARQGETPTARRANSARQPWTRWASSKPAMGRRGERARTGESGGASSGLDFHGSRGAHVLRLHGSRRSGGRTRPWQGEEEASAKEKQGARGQQESE